MKPDLIANISPIVTRVTGTLSPAGDERHRYQDEHRSDATRRARTFDQQVGQSGARLALARAQGGDAVREVNPEPGLPREHEHMVIPALSRGRADGYLPDRNVGAAEDFARPAQGLDHFSPGISTELGAEVGQSWQIPDRDLPGKPRAISCIGSDPGDWAVAGDCGDKRPPDRIDTMT